MFRKDGIDRRIWIVPAPLCATLYINNDRYLPGYTTLESERLEEQKKNNVQLLKGKSPSLPKACSSFIILGLQALRDIAIEVEPLVRYGEKYRLHGRRRT